MTENFAFVRVYARRVYSAMSTGIYTTNINEMVTYSAKITAFGIFLGLLILLVVLRNDQAVVVPIGGVVLFVAMLGALFSKYQLISSYLFLGALWVTFFMVIR